MTRLIILNLVRSENEKEHQPFRRQVEQSGAKLCSSGPPREFARRAAMSVVSFLILLSTLTKIHHQLSCSSSYPSFPFHLFEDSSFSCFSTTTQPPQTFINAISPPLWKILTIPYPRDPSASLSPMFIIGANAQEVTDSFDEGRGGDRFSSLSMHDTTSIIAGNDDGALMGSSTAPKYTINNGRAEGRGANGFAAQSVGGGIPPLPTVDPSNNKHIVLGFLRVPGEDTSDRLVGLLAAIHEANTQQLALGYNFTVETFHYPHCDITTNPAAPTCDTTTPAKLDSGVADFIGNMSRFHAVLYPTYAVSSRVISAATALGVPVIDPLTIRSDDYAAENVFLMAHHIETEIAVLVRYMFTAHSCAHTGIVHESEAARAQVVVDAFAAGGYPAPPILALPADAATIRDFYFEDSRSCLFVFMAAPSLNSFMGTVQQDARFVPGLKKVFGWSYMATLSQTINGSAAAFKDVYFPKSIPFFFDSPMTVVPTYVKRNTEYLADTAATERDFEASFFPAEVIRTSAGPGGFLYYVYSMFPIKLFAKITRYDLTNVTLARSLFIEAAYNERVFIDDFPFYLPMRTCKPYPLPDVCKCNVVNRLEYMYAFNPATGIPMPIKDNTTLGEKGISWVSYSGDICDMTVDASTFPVRTMLLTDARTENAPIVSRIAGISRELFTQGGGSDEEQELSESNLFYAFVRHHNDASSTSSTGARKRRVIVQRFPSSASSESADDDFLQQMNVAYAPFAILSADRPVTTSSSLTLAANGTFVPFSDPPLRIRKQLVGSASALKLQSKAEMGQVDDNNDLGNGFWDENIVNLSPSFADYVHAMARYYSSRVMSDSDDTLMYAAAASLEEAQLVVKSFNTFQVEISIQQITILKTASDWNEYLMDVIGGRGRNSVDLSSSSSSSSTTTPTTNRQQKPFVFAAIYDNVLALKAVADFTQRVSTGAIAAPAAASSVTAMTIALVTPDAIKDTVNITAVSLPPTFDIVFPSVLSEWWQPTNALRQMMTSAGAPMDIVKSKVSYYMVALSYFMADQLAMIASSGVRSTAAEILYTARTTSVADIPLGPFSNDTCSDDILLENRVSRSCQCSKAFRLFRIHSLSDWYENKASERTGRFSYQMTTCGVEYLPLVEKLSTNSDNTTALAVGLAVGISGALILLLAVLFLVYFICFSGRNNSKAPKDAEKPFAMAFTDIQASTMLWSRCPEVMSDAVEHHCVIIRKLIEKHKGYEVKTIGDSFMVAFKDVEDATLFAVELQTACHASQQWPSEIDQHYTEIISAQHAEAMGLSVATGNLTEDENSSFGVNPIGRVGGGAIAAVPFISAITGVESQSNVGLIGGPNSAAAIPPPAAVATTTVATAGATATGPSPPTPYRQPIPSDNLKSKKKSAAVLAMLSPPNVPYDEAEYNRLWHGLRVRVGVHFGFGEIRKDEITQGYDYFGTIVNTAARVEGVGHGGQTLVTEAVIAELTAKSKFSNSRKYNSNKKKKVPIEEFSFQHARAIRNNNDINEASITTVSTHADFIEDSGIAQISLGPQSLRGLDEKVVLYQLLPNALAARRYPQLRLDVENVVDYDNDTDTRSTAPSQHHQKDGKKRRSNSGVATEGGGEQNAASISNIQTLEEIAAQLCHEVFRTNVLQPHQQQQQPPRRGAANGGTTASVPSHSGVTPASATLLATPQKMNQSSPQLLAGGGAGGGFVSPVHGGASHPLQLEALDISMNSQQNHLANGGGGNPHNAAAQADYVARYNTAELMYHYHYLSALFATSSETWRKDTLKHLAARWRISGAKLLDAKMSLSTVDKNNNCENPIFTTAAEIGRTRTVLRILVKGMLAQRGAKAKAATAAAALPANGPNTTAIGGVKAVNNTSMTMNSSFSNPQNYYNRTYQLHHQLSAANGGSFTFHPSTSAETTTVVEPITGGGNGTTASGHINVAVPTVGSQTPVGVSGGGGHTPVSLRSPTNAASLQQHQQQLFNSSRQSPQRRPSNNNNNNTLLGASSNALMMSISEASAGSHNNNNNATTPTAASSGGAMIHQHYPNANAAGGGGGSGYNLIVSTSSAGGGGGGTASGVFAALPTPPLHAQQHPPGAITNSGGNLARPAQLSIVAGGGPSTTLSTTATHTTTNLVQPFVAGESSLNNFPIGSGVHLTGGGIASGGGSNSSGPSTPHSRGGASGTEFGVATSGTARGKPFATSVTTNNNNNTTIISGPSRRQTGGAPEANGDVIISTPTTTALTGANSVSTADLPQIIKE